MKTNSDSSLAFLSAVLASFVALCVLLIALNLNEMAHQKRVDEIFEQYEKDWEELRQSNGYYDSIP